ncbi:unnamed protein product [Blepharisma stoltei]|uniref:Uncharacterized protein n=1 Tax=Blepharisma stoltei TaxID=1481888 RepID=A0AAU9JXH2_9CILI|nr:unnamed protein product [Blepharisma stoltei]
MSEILNLSMSKTPKSQESSLALNEFSLKKPSHRINWSMPQNDLTDIIRSSLQNYPKLEKSIENLEKHPINCKCSVMTKLNHKLEKIHGFSPYPCASEFCINRILGDNKHSSVLGYFGKIDPNRKRLSEPGPPKRRKANLNGKLIINDPNLNDMNRAIDYYQKMKKNSDFPEKSFAFESYLNPPDFTAKIPDKIFYSPNFSFPKPKKQKRMCI